MGKTFFQYMNFVFGFVLFAVLFGNGRFSSESELPALNLEDPFKYAALGHEGITLPNTTLTRDQRFDMLFEQLPVSPLFRRAATIMERIAPWDQYIEKYAPSFGIDPDLVRAIVFAESGGNPDAVSPMGAAGLMQIMPGTAKFVGIGDPFDPEQNILGGVRYLSFLAHGLPQMNDSHLLWAWNAGYGSLDNCIMPDETRRFIAHVLSIKTCLEELDKLPI